ncbi:hypothetical protein C4577_07430 [Candidatus Parcubacteria bacterium]|nr:MAG: hypothetical protein C4577_07430 [Candidatus Parcubacteria bacterium]
MRHPNCTCPYSGPVRTGDHYACPFHKTYDAIINGQHVKVLPYAQTVESEMTRMKQLLAKCLWELRQHNAEYAHITKEDFLRELEQYCTDADKDKSQELPKP